MNIQNTTSDDVEIDTCLKIHIELLVGLSEFILILQITNETQMKPVGIAKSIIETIHTVHYNEHDLYLFVWLCCYMKQWMIYTDGILIGAEEIILNGCRF